MSHRRISIGIAISTAAVAAATLLATAHTTAQDSGPSAPSASVFKPIAPHHSLMEWVDHAYSGMNRAIAKQKNEVAAEHAWLLAELSNVNMQHRTEKDFRDWAAIVRDSAAKLADLAGEKKFDEAKKLSKRIRQTCNACHDKYQEG